MLAEHMQTIANVNGTNSPDILFSNDLNHVGVVNLD